MLDMLTLRTKNFIDLDYLKSIGSLRLDYCVKGFHAIATFNLKRDKSPVKFFIRKIRCPDGLTNTIELNPARFNSALNMYALLERCVPDSSKEDFKISRVDFAVDIEIPFRQVQKIVYRKRARSYMAFSSTGSSISSIVLGRPPIEAKVYDKALEKSKGSISKAFKSYPKGLTRLEVKMTRKGRRGLPMLYLNNLDSLVDFDPFTYFNFGEVKDKDTDKSSYLREVADDRTFGGMHLAYKTARKDFNMVNKRHIGRYIEPAEMPDLYSIHKEQLINFLHPKEHKPQTIGSMII